MKTVVSLLLILFAMNTFALDSPPRQKDIFKGDRVFGSVAFSPDGSLLASGSWDNTVRLWDVASGQHKTTLIGHSNRGHRTGFSPDGVAFSPDGSLLASAGGDKTVRLWDVASGQLKAVLTGHSDYVLSVAFSPDGSLLASAGGDKTVRL